MAPPIYTQKQVSQFLAHIDIPARYRLESEPARDHAFLRALHMHMITAVPYENLLLHYSSQRRGVDVDPQVVFEKIVGAGPDRGRGGYCMENSLLFLNMLRAIGFRVYPVGVKIRPRVNGVPGGDYIGWVHIVNIVTFPDGTRWASDVAFGGDGPTEPIELRDGASILNLGTQSARLVRGFTSFQTETEDPDRRLWIYECRNNSGDGHVESKPWNAFYCFSDKVEWHAADFAVCNWFTGASPESFQTTTVIVVKFLRRAVEGKGEETEIYGKRMLVNGLVKENLGGKTRLLQECRTEEERVTALKEWFGIVLTAEEAKAIDGFQTALA